MLRYQTRKRLNEGIQSKIPKNITVLMVHVAAILLPTEFFCASRNFFVPAAMFVPAAVLVLEANTLLAAILVLAENEVLVAILAYYLVKGDRKVRVAAACFVNRLAYN